MNSRHSNPRPSNTARVLAWAQQQIAEQNAALRDALENAPEQAARFEAVTSFAVKAPKQSIHAFVRATRA